MSDNFFNDQVICGPKLKHKSVKTKNHDLWGIFSYVGQYLLWNIPGENRSLSLHALCRYNFNKIREWVDGWWIEVWINAYSDT